MIRKIMIHILLWWGALLALPSLYAAELKPETAQAFDAYVRSYEKNSLLSPGESLSIDHQSPALRAQSYQRLRSGEVLIEQRKPQEERFPDAMLHHWVGTAFFPAATLDQVFSVLQDYKSYQSTYAPEVVRSRVLERSVERNQDDFKVELRLRKHKVLTVLLDTDYDVHFGRIDATRAYSRSYSTRIAEIEHPGERDERELPPGNDHGFLWRLYTYWRFVEKDGGVYAQCESISLTRDVPSGLGWLVGKFVESIPRESLVFTMDSTRKALAAQQVRAAATNKNQTRSWR